MDGAEFARVRSRLGKTQNEMSQLLGISLQAIHSYEQGWREVPPHAERHALFLLALRRGVTRGKPCWSVKKCPRELRERCPAWEFKAGRICWLVNGTLCEGTAYKTWRRKMESCRSCQVLVPLLKE